MLLAALVSLIVLPGCLEDDDENGSPLEVWNFSTTGSSSDSFTITLYDSGNATSSTGDYGLYLYLSGDRLDVILNDANDLNRLTQFTAMSGGNPISGDWVQYEDQGVNQPPVVIGSGAFTASLQ